jgi:CDP-glucose 4,6-dehydratase
MNPPVFNNLYNEKTVLVTGHTGFKGSWISIWLEKLGAKVIGFSLEEYPTNPSNFELCHLSDRLVDIRGDIREYEKVSQVIKKYQPEIVFHLAAQPILLHSYETPKWTFETNTMGTLNILEAVHQSDSVSALVCITTDKVYKNQEWARGYAEDDRLGGDDPYSASKAAAELLIHSYRASFFAGGKYHNKRVAAASARAGNVIGGGDFAEYRLVPDCCKALMNGERIDVRNPHSTRPWQHVLESLSGYLLLGEKLYSEPDGRYAKSWNFGPLEKHGIPVETVVKSIIEIWGSGEYQDLRTENTKKLESNLLMLDLSLAEQTLNWRPTYNFRDSISEIVTWFKEYQSQCKNDDKHINMYDVCSSQIETYIRAAQIQGQEWVSSD